MQTYRWCINTRDRVGMVLDVLRVLSQEGANIITMEVARGNQR